MAILVLSAQKVDYVVGYPSGNCGRHGRALVPIGVHCRGTGCGDSLSESVSGDLLIHSHVYNRALASGGGSGYEFRPMLRAVRPVIAGADLSVSGADRGVAGRSKRVVPVR